MTTTADSTCLWGLIWNVELFLNQHLKIMVVSRQQSHLRMRFQVLVRLLRNCSVRLATGSTETYMINIIMSQKNPDCTLSVYNLEALHRNHVSKGLYQAWLDETGFQSTIGLLQRSPTANSSHLKYKNQWEWSSTLGKYLRYQLWKADWSSATVWIHDGTSLQWSYTQSYLRCPGLVVGLSRVVMWLRCIPTVSSLLLMISLI